MPSDVRLTERRSWREPYILHVNRAIPFLQRLAVCVTQLILGYVFRESSLPDPMD